MGWMDIDKGKVFSILRFMTSVVKEKTRIITVFNSDETGTNDFTILRIVRDTEMECDAEFYGQLSDGVFENSNVGEFKEITDEELLKILMNKGKKEMKDIRSEVYNALADIMFKTGLQKKTWTEL